MSYTSARFLSSNLGVFSSTLLSLIVAGVFLFALPAQGVQIQNRELRLADNQAGHITTYRVSFEHRTSTDIGSVRVQFCDNDALVGAPCNPPAGFDVSAATLGAQTGMTGFSISASSTQNELILTRSAVTDPAPVTVSYVLNNVQNPDTAGSYYARIETYASTDATGVHVDYGGVAFQINEGLNITTTVPPFLLFCIGNKITSYDCNTAEGDYIDFGNFSSTATATGRTQALVATNALYGYTVRALGTTLTSGINTIPALASPDVSRVGTSQFGLNMRSNSTPSTGAEPQGPGAGSAGAGYGTANYYKFVSGEVVASSPSTDNYRLYTISYIVNVDKNQAPGIYVSTLQYIALASF